MNGEQTFDLSPRSRGITASLILLALGAVIYGLLRDPERTWPNLLLDGFYITSLAVSAMFFLTVQRVAGARWSSSLRRIPEALMLMLPIAALLLASALFGRQYLFPWTRSGVFALLPSIAGKARYLNPPWVFTRMALVLVTWTVFAWWLRRISLQQDQKADRSIELHHRLTRYSVFFMPVFALTFTLFVFDWLLSLDPAWSSTMFAFYLFAGTFVQGIAAVTLCVIMVKERGLFGNAVQEKQLHDLGKMLFAFSTFWAYIWTCQYLLIWYGNIPDEITHYARRTNGPWLYLFALNLLVNWVIPFTVLLSVKAKRKAQVLKLICVLVLCGHWLDLYLIVMPAVWDQPKIPFYEVAIAAGYVALIYLLFANRLRAAPLIPKHDPVLAYERLHQESPARRLTAERQ